MNPVVDTGQGRFRGRAGRNVLRFDGIPYAQAPLGALRLRPPEPPLPHAQIRDATEAMPAPLQRTGPALGTRPVGATSEDCLHLNVVTPALTGKRPVMVWIHGGGFVNGSAADPIHAGERLVARGNVVLVTFDYRLGVFGFLHSDEQTNLGVRDQLAALQWVQREIAAFGGDPKRVTLFGESAGAMSIRALMAAPRADDLFRAVILQSGAGTAPPEADDPGRVRRAFAAVVGSDDLAHWRTLPAEQLLDAQVRVGAEFRAATGRGAWRPLIDGELIVSDGISAQHRPVNRARPVLIGMNADEQRLFVNLRRPPNRSESELRLAQGLRGRTADPAAAAALLIAQLAAAHPQHNEAELLAAAETDLYYRLPMLQLCAARRGMASTFQYLFAWPSPALRGRLGACHALEIPFVFGTLDEPSMARFAGTDSAAEALSDSMIDAWSAFAHDGTPAGAVPAWHPWSGETRDCWVADRAPAMQRAAGEGDLDSWRQLWPGQQPWWEC